MNLFHWAALIFSVVFMSYTEGYKGFHLGFAPRVVIRANYLKDNPHIIHINIIFFTFGAQTHIFPPLYTYNTVQQKLENILPLPGYKVRVL